MSLLDGWVACPRCRADLERGDREAHCPACGFAAYANPAPTASALVVDGEGRLLLARRAREPFQGLWDIPGGFLEEGEEPLEALVRELREETGLDVEPGAYFGAWVDTYGEPAAGVVWTVNLFWLARVTGGEEAPADDVSELAWFAPDELPPPDRVAFAKVPEVLLAWRRQQQP